LHTFLTKSEITNMFLKELLWSLSYMLDDGDEEIVTSICQGKNTMQSIITYMNSPLEEEQKPALRCAGQILVSDNHENIDLFMFNGGLKALDSLLVPTQKDDTTKEILWCLSNISAGGEHHIRALLSCETLMDKIYTLLTS
jgi:hypothetical protein